MSAVRLRCGAAGGSAAVANLGLSQLRLRPVRRVLESGLPILVSATALPARRSERKRETDHGSVAGPRLDEALAVHLLGAVLHARACRRRPRSRRHRVRAGCRGRCPAPPCRSRARRSRSAHQCDAPLCLMMLLTASRRMRVVCTKARADICWSVSPRSGSSQSASMPAWPSRDTVSARQSARASTARPVCRSGHADRQAHLLERLARQRRRCARTRWCGTIVNSLAPRSSCRSAAMRLRLLGACSAQFGELGSSRSIW